MSDEPVAPEPEDAQPAEVEAEPAPAPQATQQRDVIQQEDPKDGVTLFG